MDNKNGCRHEFEAMMHGVNTYVETAKFHLQCQDYLPCVLAWQLPVISSHNVWEARCFTITRVWMDSYGWFV